MIKIFKGWKTNENKLQGWYRVTAYMDHDKTPQGLKRATGMIKITGIIMIKLGWKELQEW